jgi:hypothetical protein
MHQAFSINTCSALGTEMRSRTLDYYYHKQILSVTSAFALTASLVMVMIGGGGVMPAMTTQQQVFAQPAGGETSQAGGSQQPATTIEMTPTEVNGTYRWSVDNNINPTITLVANVNNTITVNNPTDTKHELIIAMVQGGEEEVAATPELEPNGQGQLSIIPNASDSLRYYCEYHPETMLGDIRISNATTTMSNQTQ